MFTELNLKKAIWKQKRFVSGLELFDNEGKKNHPE